MQHTNIFPIVIDLTVDGNTGTQFGTITVDIAGIISVVITYLTSDSNVIRFFLQSCNAYAKAVQLVSKFSCQTVYVSAFCHCFCYDLSHFVTGHQAIATKSAVAITVNDTSCRQLVYGIIRPMACRHIGEGICSIGRSSYAQCHCHCKY